MAKEFDNLRIYGDMESEVLVGPLGTALPTTFPLVVPPALQDMGWITEQGVPIALSTDIFKSKLWQGASSGRTKVQGNEKTFKVQGAEENPIVTGLYWDHGAPVAAGTGGARIDMPEGVGTVARSWMVKYVDDAVTKVLCVPRGDVTDREEIVHANTGLTTYGFTVQIVGAAYILTTSEAYIDAIAV